jgi:hypothetical protein
VKHSRAVCAIALLVTTLAAPSARAIPSGDGQEHAPRIEPPAPPDTDEPPAARIGWQGGVRTGAAFPAGAASGEPRDGMRQWFAWQLPIHFEGGYKPLPWLFVGPYLALAFGDTSGALLRACRSCDAKTIRIGLQAIISIAPASRINPWVGLGVGWEGALMAGRIGQTDVSQTLYGPEYVRWMAGFDLRARRSLGIGPFFEASIARYVGYTFRARHGPGVPDTRQDPAEPAPSDPRISGVDEDIPDTAIHSWITFGARLVFYP